MKYMTVFITKKLSFGTEVARYGANEGTHRSDATSGDSRVNRMESHKAMKGFLCIPSILILC
jgi:hypothetical protein